MNCKGCINQTSGKLDDGTPVKYCMGSPDHEPPPEIEKLIDESRIIHESTGDIYRASDSDECHLWWFERFGK